MIANNGALCFNVIDYFYQKQKRRRKCHCLKE